MHKITTEIQTEYYCEKNNDIVKPNDSLSLFSSGKREMKMKLCEEIPGRFLVIFFTIDHVFLDD